MRLSWRQLRAIIKEELILREVDDRHIVDVAEQWAWEHGFDYDDMKAIAVDKRPEGTVVTLQVPDPDEPGLHELKVIVKDDETVEQFKEVHLKEGRRTSTKYTDLSDQELDDRIQQLKQRDEELRADFAGGGYDRSSDSYKQLHTNRMEASELEYEQTIRRAREKAGPEPERTGDAAQDYRALIMWLDKAYMDPAEYVGELDKLRADAQKQREKGQKAHAAKARTAEEERQARMSLEDREAELARKARWAVYGGDPNGPAGRSGLGS